MNLTFIPDEEGMIEGAIREDFRGIVSSVGSHSQPEDGRRGRGQVAQIGRRMIQLEIGNHYRLSFLVM